MILSNLISEDKEMSELKVLRKKADSSFNAGNYKEAYETYNKLVNELLSYLDTTKLARSLSKGAGWLAAILTGGFGLEDLVIVPLVNKGLLKLFNIDLASLLENLGYSLRQRHVCMLQVKGLPQKVDYEIELNYFVLDFVINTKVSQSKSNKLKSILELINPISKEVGLNSIEKRKALPEVYDKLLSEIERRDGEVERINSYLFAFMEKSDKTNNPVYNRLKSKGFTV